jgi:hypothetical protein
MENLDQIPEEEGGNLYLVNGNMAKLSEAGLAYEKQKKEGTNEEVLEVEKQNSNKQRK